MNPIRNWKRFVAVTCNHAHLVNDSAHAEFFQFVENYKPSMRVHLGDVWDAACWRNGAGGGPDSSKSISEDFEHGQDFLRNFHPNIVFLGNHDVRPFEHLDHPNAIVAQAAASHVKSISDFIRTELTSEMVDYDIRKGWRRLGNTLFGHGYMHNENAARDHAEMLGAPVVIGHIHTLTMLPGRSVNAPCGYSAGCLIDVEKARYASRRRATHRWRNGWVYGEYCEDDCKVFLHAAKMEPLSYGQIQEPQTEPANRTEILDYATF